MPRAKESLLYMEPFTSPWLGSFPVWSRPSQLTVMQTFVSSQSGFVSLNVIKLCVTGFDVLVADCFCFALLCYCFLDSLAILTCMGVEVAIKESGII